MPELKTIYTPLFAGLVMALSGCSWIPNNINIDAVDDNFEYLEKKNSVRALAVPPGLSVPEFDNSYDPSALERSTSTANNTTTQTPATAPGATVRQGDNTSTAQRPPNPANRTTPEPASQAAAVTATKPNPPQMALARLKGGEPALAINAPYTRVWQQLGPVLNKVGLQVQKQQPKEGIYTTTYQGRSGAAGGAGSNLQKGTTYLILVAENAQNQSFIGVADAQGKPAPEAVAATALQMIRAELRRL